MMDDDAIEGGLKREIDEVFANTNLLAAMQEGMPNSGEEDSDEVILARAGRLVDALSRNGDFWRAI